MKPNEFESLIRNHVLRDLNRANDREKTPLYLATIHLINTRYFNNSKLVVKASQLAGQKEPVADISFELDGGVTAGTEGLAGEARVRNIARYQIKGTFKCKATLVPHESKGWKKTAVIKGSSSISGFKVVDTKINKPRHYQEPFTSAVQKLLGRLNESISEKINLFGAYNRVPD